MKRTARGEHRRGSRTMRASGRPGRSGAVIAAAAVVALSGGLAACGGNDSTVSSTPSAAATTSSDAGSSGTPAPSTSHRMDPKPTGVPETAPPETPQALPSDYPGPTVAELSQTDHKFLDTLRSKKIGFADNSDSAVSTGNYVCAAGTDGVPADQIHATVLASIALDAKNRGAQDDVEQQTSTFITVAQDTLCS